MSVNPARFNEEDIIPSSDGRGGAQVGRKPPAARSFQRTTFEAYSMDEAMDRAKKRQNGELPSIVDSVAEIPDPVEVIPSEISSDAVVNLPEPDVSPVLDAKSEARNSYLSKRERVSLSVAGGTYSIPVIDVVASDYGVMVLLPIDDSVATFGPNPGAEVTIKFNRAAYKCFFPGTVFELDTLGIQMLCFIRDEAY